MLVTHLGSKCVVDSEGCARNMDSMFARGLPSCAQLPVRAGKLAVVGSGPSVEEYLGELAEWNGDVWTVNGAYNYLLDAGIIPDAFVGCDPLPGLAEYVQRAHADTTFYISGFCDPAVFDALKEHDVQVWFPGQPGMVYPPGTLLLPGGTTALTRCPALAKLLGWRDVTIYGADSSFADDGGRYSYTYGTYVEDSKAAINKVMCNGEGPFYTEEALMKQVSQFGVLAETKALELSFRCKGLMDAYLRAPMGEFDLHDEYNRKVDAAASQDAGQHL